MLKKKISGIVLGVLLTGACWVFSPYGTRSAEAAFNTDIVGKAALASFSEMLGALEFSPAADDMMGTWVLSDPDGDAAFWWRKADGMRTFDVFLCFDAEPFINAGLDTDKLPKEMKEMLDDRGKIMVGKKLSTEPLVYDGEVTPLSSFAQIVKLDRESVGYHAALDHYGVTIADGSLFEWAKDMSKNDKDIVFVVDPKILVDAGVDPVKVEGWAYSKVPLEDSRGRKYEAEKFLKPFNLK
ncbi:MAG: hypothetical protein LBT31_07575 [Synergistaceae bacterium]|jgi:hypothetical protein|nr:hypothetical protein [Synergistaceae bacterium]